MSIAARCLGCGAIIATRLEVGCGTSRDYDWTTYEGTDWINDGRCEIDDWGEVTASPCRCTEVIRELRERVGELEAERDLVRAAVSHEDAIEFDLAGISVARRSDAWGPFYVLTRPDDQARWTRVNDSPEFKTLYDALPLVGKMKKERESV